MLFTSDIFTGFHLQRLLHSLWQRFWMILLPTDQRWIIARKKGITVFSFPGVWANIWGAGGVDGISACPAAGAKAPRGSLPIQHQEVDLQVLGAGAAGHGQSHGQILRGVRGGPEQQQSFGQTLPKTWRPWACGTGWACQGLCQLQVIEGDKENVMLKLKGKRHMWC